MFKRSLEKELQLWADSTYRKPLVLRGARQVGKTTLVNQFAVQFENYLSVNLEKPDIRRLFESTGDVKKLLQLLFLYHGVDKKAGRTLLFIDEIQNSPHVVALLRYFYEELPELHVIAAGSMLETMLDTHISLPVGRVTYKALHPCSYVEFLQASGKESRLEFIYSNEPVPEPFHAELIHLFSTYALIGGMPEVIARYTSENDFSALTKVYSELINAYKNDVEKYAQSNTQAAVIRYILEDGWSFSGQNITLGGFGGSPYKARETGEAFRILSKALLLELVYPTTNTLLPVVSDLKKTPKLIWFDAGLVNYAAGIQKEFLTSSDLRDVWRGNAAEQIVAQELKAMTSEVSARRNYWMRNKRGSSAEVDFVFVHNGFVVPVEVKSGHNAHLKSLHQFMNETNHDVAIRVWSGNYSVDVVKTNEGKSFRLINLPFYRIAAIPHILEHYL